MGTTPLPSARIALFRGKEIRKILYKNEWWFSIIDVVGALTDNERARKYWNDLKRKLIEEGYSEVSDNIGQLKLPASDGKNYFTDCANTETIFRIIQSIPSPKAEPFKDSSHRNDYNSEADFGKSWFNNEDS